MDKRNRFSAFFLTYARGGLSVIITAAIILEATALLQFYYSGKAIRAEATRRAEQELEATALEISDVMDQVETAVRNNLWAARKMLSQPDSLYEVTRRILTYNHIIAGSAVALMPDYYRSRGRYYSPYSFRQADTISSKQLGSEAYDYFSMEWYVEGIKHHRGYWSEPYFDEGGGEMLMTTFSMPVYDMKGNTVGVMTADMSLDWLTDVVNDIAIYPNAYSLMFSRSGVLMVSPDDTLSLRRGVREYFSDVEDTTVAHALTRAMLERGRGSANIRRGNKLEYIFYAPVERTGWEMAVIIPADEIFKRVRRMAWVVTALQLLGLGMLFLILRHSARSLAFLKEAETGRERIEGELRIASGIQMSMIPKAFPERSDLDMAASLDPAKEVGGDFYDFFLRDGRLYFCIGDVSGKGVPASLVMAVTRSLFRTASKAESTPEEVFLNMNASMAEMNENDMFVTAFLGVLDLSTGGLRFCNAGHNAPLVLSPDGTRPLDVLPNIPLGIIPQQSFSGQETCLQPGQTLFLYTDGLTEAENIHQEFFGEDRLLEAAAEVVRLPAADQVFSIREAVSRHVGEAPQSDDLTMMSIKYLGASPEHHLTLTNDIQQIALLADFVEVSAGESGFSASQTASLQLALEEAVTNVILYAYPEGTEGTLEIDARPTPGRLVFTITDAGKPFDPTARPEVDITLPAEERAIGGLGIHLVRKIMDEVTYRREDGKNILYLVKNLS